MLQIPLGYRRQDRIERNWNNYTFSVMSTSIGSGEFFAVWCIMSTYVGNVFVNSMCMEMWNYLYTLSRIRV